MSDNELGAETGGRGNTGGLLAVPCDQCRARKVKCDRQLPQCSNCQKTGAACSVVRKPIRTNITKELRDDLSLVLKRMDGVEHQLDLLRDHTKQIASQQVSMLESRSRSQSFQEEPGRIHDVQHTRYGGVSYHVPGRGRHVLSTTPKPERVSLLNGGKASYGHLSPLALCQSFVRQAKRVAKRSNPVLPVVLEQSVHSALQHMVSKFPLGNQCAERFPIDDGEPIACPPRSLVEIVLEGYLQDINAFMPIFNPSSLRDAVVKLYGRQLGNQEMAWALILSNVALIQLKLVSMAPMSADNVPMLLNDDLKHALLLNCERALTNRHLFESPTYLNIQALATLTLATREFYHHTVSDSVCQWTCLMARTLGLHRQHQAPDVSCPSPKPSLDEPSEERDNLFWVLYILDKQRSWMSGGGSCDFYLFDVNVPLQIEKENSYNFAAMVDLMAIWEDTYMLLNSPMTHTAGYEEASRETSLIEARLEDWHEQHVGSNRPVFDGETPWLKMELKCGYHTLRMILGNLVNDGGTSREELDQPHLRLLDDARRSLQVISRFADIPPSTHRAASISRIFRNQTIVAFKELASFHLSVLCDTGTEDANFSADSSLLDSFLNCLDSLRDNSTPQAYYSRLWLGLRWILDTVMFVRNVAADANNKVEAPGFMAGVHSYYGQDNGHCADEGVICGENPDLTPAFQCQPSSTQCLDGTEASPLSAVDPSDYNPLDIGMDMFNGLSVPIIRERLEELERNHR